VRVVGPPYQPADESPNASRTVSDNPRHLGSTGRTHPPILSHAHLQRNLIALAPPPPHPVGTGRFWRRTQLAGRGQTAAGMPLSPPAVPGIQTRLGQRDRTCEQDHLAGVDRVR